MPLDMCPCGNKKATVRRFLVARKYKVDEAEKMIRDAIEWRKTCKVGDLVVRFEEVRIQHPHTSGLIPRVR